jgi:hypothetical protein
VQQKMAKVQLRSLILAFILALSTLVVAESVLPTPSRQKVVQSFAALPIGYEPNWSQAGSGVLYLMRTAAYSVYLSRGALLVRFDKTSGQAEEIRITLAGADRNVEPKGTDILPGVHNYYIGDDPAKWRVDVRQFRQVLYSNIYPGIDLRSYSSLGELEFDFDVKPGADCSDIALRISGALVNQRNGNLELMTPHGKKAVLKKPKLYQEDSGSQHKVLGSYVIRKDGRVGFSVGRYDRRKKLIIDPALVYSTFAEISGLQDSIEDVPFGIATDSSGAVYVTGQTQENNTARSFSAFVIKIDPTGSNLVYATHIGGSKLLVTPSPLATMAAGQEIAVDGSGNSYIAGMTQELDFPTTGGSFSTTAFCASTAGNVGCLEPFAAKLDANGNLVYSTFLVQSAADSAGPVPSSLAIDANGAIYVTGILGKQSLPATPLSVAGLGTTPGAFQTTRNSDSSSFVLKLHADGSRVDYATYLGGSTGETPGGITVDSAGVAYVDGGTSSSDFPVTPGASQTTNPATSAFFSKLKADGSGLLYSTFFSGPLGQSEATSIAIDSSHAAYLTGVTTDVFPNPTFGNRSLPAFAAKFDPTGLLVYSTPLGKVVPTQITYGLDLFVGTPPQSSIAVDATGVAYVATGSGGFSNASMTETKLSPAGAELYAVPIGPIDPHNSRFAGVALDGNQNFYLTGVAGSLADSAPQLGGVPVFIPDVGTTAGALQIVPTGARQQELMFVQKYSQSLGSAVAVPNPRQISFSPILQKGTTSSARTIEVFNYGDADLAITGTNIGGNNASDFAISTAGNTCGTTVIAGLSCRLSVTFSPTVNSGIRSAVVNLSFGGGLASQTVSLAGQAGSAVFQANPPSLDFGDVATGATSGIMTLTVTNSGTGPMNLLSTPVFQGSNPADFGVCALAAGHCGGIFNFPTTVPPSGNFTVPLVFTPTGSGSRTAQLTFVTNAAGSPQTVQLRGTATNLLGISTPSGTSATITAGQTATYSLIVTTSSAQAVTINVTCAGAPPQTSCNANPSTFSIDSTVSKTVTVSVPTTARPSASILPESPLLWWSLAGAFAIVLLPLGRGKRRPRLMVFAVLLLLSAISCGGGSGKTTLPPTPTPTPTPTPSPGTPAGTYTLNITATGSGASDTLALTLKVL